MKHRLAAILMFVIPALAQSTLPIDISGEWRMSTDDKPQYAQPGFDDSRWTPVKLPWTKLPPTRNIWLRRTVELAPATDPSQLTVVLGTIGEVYAVYVNGVFAGRTGEFTAGARQIARPRAFAIPQGAVHADRPVVIAVRRWSPGLFGSTSWIIFHEGPYLLTHTAYVPGELETPAIDRRWIRQTPDLITAAAQLTLTMLLLIAWLAERKQVDLFWLAFYLANEAVYSILLTLLLSPETFVWSWNPLFRTIVTLRAAALAAFVLTSMSIKSRWWWWIIGLSTPFALFREQGTGTGSYIPVGLSVITVVLIGIGWTGIARRRESIERHVFAALLVVALIAQTNRIAVISLFPNRLMVGRYAWSIHELLITILGFAITVLLLRRLLADRREKQRLSNELEAARVIQQLLLKQPALRHPDLTLDAVYLAAAEVGGDFYHVLDGEVVIVGDVSGKGLKAAMVVSLLIGVLRGVSQRTPAAVLGALNQALAGQMEGGFVTCCCMRFDSHGTVILANAGHLAPYMNGIEGSLETGLPLGLDPDAAYRESSLTLLPGSNLTFVSDGVVEASRSGELFGFDRTRDVSTQSARAIADAAKAWGQNDDITVVTVRRSA